MKSSKNSAVTLTISTSDSNLIVAIMAAISSGKATLAGMASSAAMASEEPEAKAKPAFDPSTCKALTLSEKACRILADIKGEGKTTKVAESFGLTWIQASALLTAVKHSEAFPEVKVSPKSFDAISAALAKLA